MSNSNNSSKDTQKNKCPYGFHHGDFDKFSVSSNSKCPLGYIYKLTEPVESINKCPYDFEHEDFDKFIISLDSKCPLGYKYKSISQ